MPTDDRTSEQRLAEIEAAVRRHQEERERFLAGLGFDWEASPRIEHGLLHEHPLVPPRSLRVTMRDGRIIELRTLYQYYTQDRKSTRLNSSHRL